VAVISLVEANVPAARLTEGITWVMTGVGLGIAPGAAVAGVLIDGFGANTAYWVAVVSGALAAGLTWVSGTRAAWRVPVFEEV
jgi:predicted MFS family arabinose efflux permease